MKLTRRQWLKGTGAGIATLVAPLWLLAEEHAVIEMRGTPRGERIWFTPQGLLVPTGTVVRFSNKDPVNSHTATTYHPSLNGRPARIPEQAEPWDSGYLMPGEHFDVRLDVPGVYDYYCVPHEHAGMVGRIVVDPVENLEWQAMEDSDDELPEAVTNALPSVESILHHKRVIVEN